MRFSAFNGFGLATFTGDEPRAETIYKAINIAVGAGKAFDVSEGTDIEATNFADAIAVACAERSLHRARLNLAPETATEKLPQHEAAFVVAPPVDATIAERRAVLAAKNLAARGSREEALTNTLRAVLGSDFVALYVSPQADVQKWPTTVGGAPGHYSRVDIPAKTIRLLEHIAPDFGVSGVATVPYENWDTSQADELVVVGEKLVVECEIPGGAEVVTITAAAGEGTARTLTATFTKPHPLGCSATTRPTPLQLSTRRHILVVLKIAAAKRVETRRLVNEIMRSVIRGVTTWSVVHESSDGSAFFASITLDVESLDAVTIANFSR